jgi:predicted RNase H-like nuclease (RuvC/YqgF family)
LNEAAIKSDTDVIKAEAEKSSMSDEEKAAFNQNIDELNSKLQEKDDIIKELQTRYTAQEAKNSSLVTDNENMRMDTTVNKQVIDKYEADPKIQEFFALKTKADAGNEKAVTKLTEFYKSALSDM